MPDHRELEDLEHLIDSPGWSLFLEMANAQWSASSEWFLTELDKALGSDHPQSHEHFRQIRASQREIQKVLQLVPDRIKQLQQPASAASLPQSRRGTL